MNKHLVFVYGTLRQGGLRAMPNLFPDSKFVGRASLRGSLYDLGPYPALLLEESDSSVTGEVYEIDDEILNKLDEIEATAQYWRKQVEVSFDNRSMICWVYAPDARSYPQRRLITSGDWIEYARTKTVWPEDVWPDEA
ncbi:MAG: gamma-glutamylcyclotransferase [Pyrinomonadaceae bacterium]|nr:gamma-glutamylcyclotransferase [Pyrinomonadaceae bacterium]